MAIFVAGDGIGKWQPGLLAQGPFSGLQGGAVAGLLVGEIEALAADNSWGEALSATAWFLRPTPLVPLRTEVRIIQKGRRLSVVDNTLWAEGTEVPCATVRVTLVQPHPIDIPSLAQVQESPTDPDSYPRVHRPAPHGGPWFMEAMEARQGDGVWWFKLRDEVVVGAGPLARIMGPADWAHGLTRPVSLGIADPNPNLTVQLLRPPEGEWVGVEPQTRWRPEHGSGMGGGLLRDAGGVIGMVSMSVALTPMPAVGA